MSAKELSLQLSSSNFKGLILNPSQLSTDSNSATLCSNTEKNEAGQLTIRPGANVGASYTLSDLTTLFPFTYTYYDPSDGSTNEEVLLLEMGMSLYAPRWYRKNPKQVVITYVGAGTGTILIQPSATVAGTYDVTVTTNGSNSLTTSYAGANTVSYAGSSTLDSFINSLHGLAGYDCSPTTIAATNNRHLIEGIGSYLSISLTNGQTYTLDYFDIEAVETTTLNFNSKEQPTIGIMDANFVLPCALNYANVLYFTYGSYEYKYDGLHSYRSGLPQATISAIADSAGGTSKTIGDTYIYKIVYARTDAKGNIIEGEDSDDTLAVATHTMVATRDIDITINNYSNTAYPNFAQKTNYVNGLQAGVTTITLTTTTAFVVGDNVYFYDGVSASYVTREITALTATTITIDGAAVNVTNGLAVSNNTRIQIWRTKANATDFYLVAEIPNQSNVTTQVYTDSVADSALVEPFVEQLRKHSLPPKCTFLGEHQGLKISAGDPENPNKISWALPNDVEGYPLESNNTDIKGGGLGALTGFGTVDDDGLAVFKELGHVLIDGSLDDLNFRILNRSNTGVGCVSFRTLCTVGDKNALVGLSASGPFAFRDRVPDLVFSESIRPLFKQLQKQQVNSTDIEDTNGDVFVTDTLSVDFIRVLKRAVGFNDPISKNYHLYLPAEAGTTDVDRFINTASSKHLVYHYDPLELFWDEYTYYDRYRSTFSGTTQYKLPNAANGFYMYKNALWFGSQLYDHSAAIHTRLYKFNNTGNKYDYNEAAYPVYMDLHFTPFTREQGSASTFFKPLRILISRFLNIALRDPAVTVSFGDNFTLAVKTVRDYREYASATLSTNSSKTFYAANANTSLLVKCVTAKAKAYQIQISNEDAVAANFEVPIIDNVEFTYAVPFDRRTKEPVSSNG